MADPPHPCPDELQDPTLSPGAEADNCQRVELLFTSGSLKGKKTVVDEGKIPVASKATTVYKRGDRVIVDYLHGGTQPPSFFIIDFVRTNQIYVLALIFVALAIGFGGWRGFTSLIGLAISFVVLLFFMLPRIIAGDDPVTISIIGGFGIMLVTLYLSHGFNRKTTAALCGTAISLLITGLLAWLSVDFIRLSGFGSDEASFVQVVRGGAINLQGLLLGGIIIGALGVLDDVTIGQSAAVFELHNVDPSLPWQALPPRHQYRQRSHRGNRQYAGAGVCRGLASVTYPIYRKRHPLGSDRQPGSRGGRDSSHARGKHWPDCKRPFHNVDCQSDSRPLPRCACGPGPSCGTRSPPLIVFSQGIAVPGLMFRPIVPVRSAPVACTHAPFLTEVGGISLAL